MTINSNPSATLFEIHEMTQLSVSGVRKIIDRLREQGVIKRIGPDKGGHWELLRNEIEINGDGSF